jgi:hypothetical protein
MNQSIQSSLDRCQQIPAAIPIVSCRHDGRRELGLNERYAQPLSNVAAHQKADRGYDKRLGVSTGTPAARNSIFN